MSPRLLRRSRSGALEVRYAGSSGSTAFGHPPRDQGVQPGLFASGYEPTVRADKATGLKESRDR